VNNYNYLDDYNNRQNIDYDWAFSFDNNYNPTNDVYEINHDLYRPYDGYIRGNLFKNLYSKYKLNQPLKVNAGNEQAELLIYIDALSFAAHELNLYLDIFPNDTEMIKKFNEYRKEVNKAMGSYEQKYGPLFVNSSASDNTPWAWNSKSPWPWDKED
jgi:hypothetical protein